MEENNKLWICEGIGFYEFKSEPMELSAVQAEFKNKIALFYEEWNDLSVQTITSPTEFEFTSDDGDMYLALWYYPVPESTKARLRLLVDRAYYRLEAYTFYTDNIWPCLDNISELRSLIASLQDDTDNPPSFDGWVSLAERKPEINGEYIVYTRNDLWSEDCTYEVASAFWDTDHFVDLESLVSHWRPMPEAPIK